MAISGSVRDYRINGIVDIDQVEAPFDSRRLCGDGRDQDRHKRADNLLFRTRIPVSKSSFHNLHADPLLYKQL